MPRISGKLGQVSLDGGSTFIADIFDWTLEWRVRADECGIKGEKAEAYSLGEFTGRITARRHATNSVNDTKLARAALTAALTAGNLTGGTNIGFQLKQIAGASTGTQIDGTGYVVVGGLTSPRTMAEDSLEITLDSIPTVS